MLYGTVNFFQIGELKKGLNPPSFGDLVFVSPYLKVAIKTGIITGVIALAVRNLLIPSLLYAYYLQKKIVCVHAHHFRTVPSLAPNTLLKESNKTKNHDQWA